MNCPQCGNEAIPPMADAKTGPEALALCDFCPAYLVASGEVIPGEGIAINEDGTISAVRGKDRRMLT